MPTELQQQAAFLRILADQIERGEATLQQFPATNTFVLDSESPTDITVPGGNNTLTIEYTKA